MQLETGKGKDNQAADYSSQGNPEGRDTELSES